MGGFLRGKVDARLQNIQEIAGRIRASLYSCPSVTIAQLEEDLGELADLARNLADRNNRD